MVTDAPMIPVMAARIVPMTVTASASAPGNALQQNLDTVQQVVGNPAPLHHDAHEHERRNRDQHQVSRRPGPRCGE